MWFKASAASGTHGAGGPCVAFQRRAMYEERTQRGPAAQSVP